MRPRACQRSWPARRVEVPVRQWVLTVPFALRYRLAYDAALTSVVLREFVRGAFASYASATR